MRPRWWPPGLDLVAILALFASTRFAAWVIPFGALGYPSGYLVITDVNLYEQWSAILTAGAFPAADPMWQYPPLAAPLFLVGRVVATYSYGFMTAALAADALALAGLLWAAWRRGNWTGAWLWAAAAAIVGPVFLTRFDLFPTAAVILGLLVVASRPRVAGVLLGIGAALKVWPLLALSALRQGQLPLGLAGAAAALGLSSLVMWAWFGTQSWAFIDGQSQRGLQIESVAALPFVVAHGLGVEVHTAFRYGSVELDVAGAGAAGALATLTGVGLLGWLTVLRVRGRLDAVPGPDVAFTAVLVAVATSRVFSPQYSIWLVGIGAACLATRATRMHWPVGLVGVAAVLTQAVYPHLYTDLITGQPVASALQVLRIGLIVAATAMAMTSVVLRGSRPRRSRSTGAHVGVSASQ